MTPNWITLAALEIVNSTPRDNHDAAVESVTSIIAKYAPGWHVIPRSKGKWFQVTLGGRAKLRTIVSPGACGRGDFYGPIEMPEKTA